MDKYKVCWLPLAGWRWWTRIEKGKFGESKPDWLHGHQLIGVSTLSSHCHHDWQSWQWSEESLVPAAWREKVGRTGVGHLCPRHQAMTRLSSSPITTISFLKLLELRSTFLSSHVILNHWVDFAIGEKNHPVIKALTCLNSDQSREGEGWCPSSFSRLFFPALLLQPWARSDFYNKIAA